MEKNEAGGPPAGNKVGKGCFVRVEISPYCEDYLQDDVSLQYSVDATSVSRLKDGSRVAKGFIITQGYVCEDNCLLLTQRGPNGSRAISPEMAWAGCLMFSSQSAPEHSEIRGNDIIILPTTLPS